MGHMKYLGFHRNASIDGGDDAEPNANAAGGPVHAKDRRQALLEFTSPKTSVVHRALSDGASLFEDEKKWAAYFSYNVSPLAEAYLKLWAMVHGIACVGHNGCQDPWFHKELDAEDISHSVRRP